MRTAGFSLTEILVAISLLALATVFITGVYTMISNQVARNDFNVMLFQLQSNLTRQLLDAQAWEQTMSRAPVAIKNCWDGTSETPCRTWNPSTWVAFNLYGANGNLYQGYDPVGQAGHGFDMKGERCTTFSGSSPSAACPVRVTFEWRPLCPLAASSVPCVRPESEVNLTFTFSFPARSFSAGSAKAFTNKIRIPGHSVVVRLPANTDFRCAWDEILTGLDSMTGAPTCAKATGRVW